MHSRIQDDMKSISDSRSVVCGSLLYGNMAGLESDIASDINPELNSIKIEVEIENSRNDIKSTAIEIEVCLKTMNNLERQIILDENAYSKEMVNKEVIDYSIASYNQLSEEAKLEPLEMSGMESAMDSIKDGFKYVINNKIEILKKVWEKLKALYEAFIKKIKDFWKKLVIAFMQYKNYSKRFKERLSPYGVHEKVNASDLTTDALFRVNKCFCIPALANADRGQYFFSLNKATDTDKLREVFSGKMFIDIDSVINDGKLKKRDVEILTFISNPDILKKHFNLATKGLTMSFEKSMPINFQDDMLAIAFSDNGKFENIIPDRAEDNLNLVVDIASLSNSTMENISVDMGTYHDIILLTDMLDNFLQKDIKPALNKTQESIDKVNDKVKEYQNELANANNITGLEKKLNSYKGIYNVLKQIVEMNVLFTYRYTTNMFKMLDVVTTDLEVAAVIAKDKAAMK